MKGILLIIFMFSIIGCKETTEIYDEARGEVRTCDKGIGSTCAKDGSMCINECGEKLFTIICFKTHYGFTSIGITGERAPVPENYCDVMFESEYDYAVWQIEQNERK